MPVPTAVGERLARAVAGEPSQKTLTRSALVAQIAARGAGLTEDDVRFTVSLLLTAITEHVARGGRVEIRGFGSFVRRLRRARISRNPGTGAQVIVDAKFVPHFKMSGEFRRGLNASLAADARSVGAAPTSPPHQGRQENANALTRVSA
ncbi:MAG: integration host factor subunit beta [Sulfuritalea sp.]|nr:integration host factor subunit beta [Sulfuritalea sp.]